VPGGVPLILRHPFYFLHHHFFLHLPSHYSCMHHEHDSHPIIERVIRAIALNRHPGYHFAGNFLGLAFTEVRDAHSVLELSPGIHCQDADGQTNLAAVAMLADIGLATGIRANLDGATRLATVALSLQMTGVPRLGPLKASSVSQGFIQGSSGKQGLSCSTVTAGGEQLCFGTGAFMVLRPPNHMTLSPIPWVENPPPVHVALDLDGLSEDEQWILAHARRSLTASLEKGDDFIRHFFGFSSSPDRAGRPRCFAKRAACWQPRGTRSGWHYAWTGTDDRECRAWPGLDAREPHRELCQPRGGGNHHGTLTDDSSWQADRCGAHRGHQQSWQTGVGGADSSRQARHHVISPLKLHHH